MFTRLDEWLMDRVFQPLSDRVADRCSPFRLAVIGTEIVMLMVAGRLLVDMTQGAVGVAGAIFSGLIIFLAWGAKLSAIQSERQYRVGARNPLRLRFSVARKLTVVLFLVLVGVDVLAWWVNDDSITVRDVTYMMEIAGWFIFYHFASCDRNPPFVAQERENRVYAF